MRTPLRSSPWLTAITGAADVRIKIETLQPTFSYKIRGAFNAVRRLAGDDNLGAPALVTASAGNHGRALAHAARTCGMPVTVYVSERAPAIKIDAIRAEGAALRLCRDYDEAERRAKAHGATGEAVYVSPYAHPDVIAGAGTVGLEITEDWPEVDTIVVAVGGGGLISGIAIAAHAGHRLNAPGARAPIAIVGVEAEASLPFTASLAAGRIVEIAVQDTLADGLAGNLDPDTPTFEIVRTRVSEIVRVTEQELRAAVPALMTHERLIAEGAGAAAVAALQAGRYAVRGRHVAVVLSGGNIDPHALRALL